MSCPPYGTEYWFDPLTAAEARATCNRCVDMMPCRRYATKTMQGDGICLGTGIYGGHGPLDRMIANGSRSNVIPTAKMLWRTIVEAPGVQWTQALLRNRTAISDSRVKLAMEMMVDSGWVATDGAMPPHYAATSDVPPWET